MWPHRSTNYFQTMTSKQPANQQPAQLMRLNGALTAVDPAGQQAPFYVDFTNSDFIRRMRRLMASPLVRACGINKGNPSPRILDVSAGLCRDAVLLAAAGAQVTAVEASSEIYQLAADGLERGKAHYPWLAERFTLRHTNAKAMNAQDFDVIYLDPMFDDPSRSTPKKQAQWLQALSLNDSSLNAFFDHALTYTGKRIVIKRAKKSDFYGGKKPTNSLPTKQLRFDVVLT